jgi:thiamine biosynthesis lipoprotein
MVIDFEAIGTVWKIEVFDTVSAAAAQKMQSAVLKRINTFDKQYSRFRDDSWVTLMSREAGRYTLPADAKPLLDLYAKLYEVSSGKVTPLIGQTLEEAGYDASYSLKPGKLHKLPKWEDVIEYSFPYLTLKKPALLDFGAAGKGYLIDIIADLISKSGVNSYLVNAGGDMVYHTDTSKSIEIGLEHPEDPSMAIGVAKIHNQSLCGSSGNRRAWGKFHHIIDPVSLKSPREIAAIWVIADTGLVADGLTTALFFVDPSEVSKHFNFEYAIISSDMSLEHSNNFPADFFVGEENEKIG